MVRAIGVNLNLKKGADIYFLVHCITDQIALEVKYHCFLLLYKGVIV